MALLSVIPSKKIKALCTLEESTAIMVDQYAAFIKAPADDVVNKALEYIFTLDKDFQKYRQTNPAVPASLRVQLPAKPLQKPTAGAKSKPSGLLAAD